MSASWKLFGATLVIVIGTVAVVVSLSVPTTICTTTTADSEVVERSCSTNERLSTVLRAALGVGIVAAAAGIGGCGARLEMRDCSGVSSRAAYCWRSACSSPTSSAAGSGTSSPPIPPGEGPLGLGLLLLVAVVGVGVAALGGRTLVRSGGSG